MNAPIFKHDCPQCVFLGTWEGKEDLYFCPQVHVPTVLARYGNKPEEYESGLNSGSRAPLQKAQRLAVKRKLL